MTGGGLAKLLPKPKHSSASDNSLNLSTASSTSTPSTTTTTTLTALDNTNVREINSLSNSSTANSNNNNNNIVPRQYDETTGRLRYEVLAHVGHGPERMVQARHADTVAQSNDIVQARPTPEQVAEETAKVQRALEVILEGKIRATQPKSITGRSDGGASSSIVTFNAAGKGLCTTQEGSSTNTIQRIVRMVEAPRDPLEPPKFRHKRIPRPPGSPPAPVLHSPPRKATAEEQRAWKIPPCVSNWKNPKGYTIPLDKRLAADGRGLVETGINDNFARVAESLYLAERHAREEVAKRAAIERKLAEQEKMAKEDALRELARQAREEKALLSKALRKEQQEASDAGTQSDHRRSRWNDPTSPPPHNQPGYGSTSLREREEIRRERAYQIERDLRVSRMGATQRARYLDRQADRDISERIALGMAPVGGGGDRAAADLYDQRLFDRTSGVGPGWGDEEEYNLYEGPLFRGARADAHVIYKPGRGAEADHNVVDDSGGREEPASSSGGGGGGPVEFERASDPFGLDQFLQEARKAPPK